MAAPYMIDGQLDPSSCHGACHKMRQRLWDYQQRGEFCDIILETDGGERVLAHRVIVAANSEVLYGMLLDPGTLMDSENQETQTLKLPGVSSQGLQDLIRTAYLGSIQEIRSNAASLWEKVQICDPERNVNEEIPTHDVIADPCSEVKSENVTSEDGYAEDEGGNNELEITDDVSSTTAETSEKKEDIKSPANRTRKRKCTSPKRRATRSWVSIKDQDIKQSEITARARRRKKRTVVSSRRIKTKLGVATEGPKCSEDSETGVGSGKKLNMVIIKPKMVKAAEKALCKTCNIQFNTAKLYREHRETMHKPCHKCCECEATFIRAKQLKAHRIANHYKEGLPQPTWHHCKADGCTYKTIYKYALGTHYTAVHTKEKAICETCGAIFSRPETLKLHIRRVHHGVGPSYPCDQCEKGFYSPGLLKAHQDRVHNKTLRYLCDQCPFMGFDKESVSTHMFRRHGVPLPGAMTSYTCPYCGYKSPSKSNMRDHIERHEPQDYKCDLCDSVFPCSRDLRAHHSATHTKRKRVTHQCPHDGCKYISKYGPSALKDHISRMHEKKDYKPWVCSECTYRTNVKGNLTLHMRNVHGLRPPTRQHRVHKLTPGGAAVPPPSGQCMNDETLYTEKAEEVCPPVSYSAMSMIDPVPVPVPVPVQQHSAYAGTDAEPGLPPNLTVMPMTPFGLATPPGGYQRSYMDPEPQHMSYHDPQE